jgi:large subunit ribosomal protein L6
MSRIGKKPVPLPNGVSAARQGRYRFGQRPKGELKLRLVPEVGGGERRAIAITPREERIAPARCGACSAR